MNDKLPPPDGYETWLDYAVLWMPTRLFHVDVVAAEHDDERHGWPANTTRAEMVASAQRELRELRKAAGAGDG